MVKGKEISSDLAVVVPNLRRSGSKLQNIATTVGKSESWVRYISKERLPLSGEKINLKMRGRKPIDELDNQGLLQVMVDYDNATTLHYLARRLQE